MKYSLKVSNTLKQGLKAAGVSLKRATYTAGTQIADKLMEESIKRSPIDKGHLEQSHQRRVDRTTQGVEALVFIPANSPAADYALYMHELHYELGSKSAVKQGGVNVTVGRKYLERALMENIALYQKFLTSYLKGRINSGK